MPRSNGFNANAATSRLREGLPAYRLLEDFLALIDAKLDQVFAQPGAWGGRDALEPLVLMLCILREQLLEPDLTDSNIISAYVSLLGKHLGSLPLDAGDLKSRLGSECSEADMISVLREQVQALRKWPWYVSR